MGAWALRRTLMLGDSSCSLRRDTSRLETVTSVKVNEMDRVLVMEGLVGDDTRRRRRTQGNLHD